MYNPVVYANSMFYSSFPKIDEQLTLLSRLKFTHDPENYPNSPRSVVDIVRNQILSTTLDVIKGEAITLLFVKL